MKVPSKVGVSQLANDVAAEPQQTQTKRIFCEAKKWRAREDLNRDRRQKAPAPGLTVRADGSLLLSGNDYSQARGAGVLVSLSSSGNLKWAMKNAVPSHDVFYWSLIRSMGRIFIGGSTDNGTGIGLFHFDDSVNAPLCASCQEYDPLLSSSAMAFSSGPIQTNSIMFDQIGNIGLTIKDGL